MEFFPLVARFAGEARVGFARGVSLLAREFLKTLPAVEIERAVVERGLDRATGFGAVRAIGETAAGGERGDVGECRVKRVGGDVPELEFVSEEWGCGGEAIDSDLV